MQVTMLLYIIKNRFVIPVDFTCNELKFDTYVPDKKTLNDSTIQLKSCLTYYLMF